MGKLRTYNRRRLRKARSCDWRGWIKHGKPYGCEWHQARMKHGGGRVRKDWDDPFKLEEAIKLLTEMRGVYPGDANNALLLDIVRLQRRLDYLNKRAMEQDPLCRQTWTLYPSALKKVQAQRGTHFFILDIETRED